jgi:hypothetical protein
MKDLFKTFCWTVGVLLILGGMIGLFVFVGFLCSLCPAPSQTVRCVIACSAIFGTVFFIVHLFRHPSNDIFVFYEDKPD